VNCLILPFPLARFDWGKGREVGCALCCLRKKGLGDSLATFIISVQLPSAPNNPTPTLRHRGVLAEPCNVKGCLHQLRARQELAEEVHDGRGVVVFQADGDCASVWGRAVSWPAPRSSGISRGWQYRSSVGRPGRAAGWWEVGAQDEIWRPIGVTGLGQFPCRADLAVSYRRRAQGVGLASVVLRRPCRREGAARRSPGACAGGVAGGGRMRFPGRRPGSPPCILIYVGGP